MLFSNTKHSLRKKAFLFFFSILAISNIGYSHNNPTDPITKNKDIFETNDHVIVVRNNSVIFEYLQTEEDIESPVQLRVIKQPKFGDVTLNEDQTFKYAPLQNLCEKNDVFVYEMTVGEHVTQVNVSIDILCESITFMSGTSSDEKAGKLKNFTIHGIENYPDNSLYVFNGKGIEVFQKDNYSNDWDGKIDKKNNPDEESGIYYYVFNDGGGTYYSGYLQVN